MVNRKRLGMPKATNKRKKKVPLPEKEE